MHPKTESLPAPACAQSLVIVNELIPYMRVLPNNPLSHLWVTCSLRLTMVPYCSFDTIRAVSALSKDQTSNARTCGYKEVLASWCCCTILYGRIHVMVQLSKLTESFSTILIAFSTADGEWIIRVFFEVYFSMPCNILLVLWTIQFYN